LSPESRGSEASAELLAAMTRIGGAQGDKTQSQVCLGSESGLDWLICADFARHRQVMSLAVQLKQP